jgi:hypothetical protein
MRSLCLPTLLFISFALFAGCSRKSKQADASPLSYGDSILYLVNTSGETIVNPTTAQTGQYTAWPEGLEINDRTGAINVSKSETGLRYRVSFQSESGDTASTMVILSGVNYLDRYHNFANGDSILRPVYNAEPSRPLPAGSFDESRLAAAEGCAVTQGNGQVNLAKTLRDGFLGSNPQNDACKEVEIAYNLNDASGRASNKIKIKIYYYNTINDVTEEIRNTLIEREGMILGAQWGGLPITASTGRVTGRAKPRPPCIIIIAH